jgi:hypothetical protein
VVSKVTMNHIMSVSQAEVMIKGRSPWYVCWIPRASAVSALAVNLTCDSVRNLDPAVLLSAFQVQTTATHFGAVRVLADLHSLWLSSARLRTVRVSSTYENAPVHISPAAASNSACEMDMSPVPSHRPLALLWRH